MDFAVAVNLGPDNGAFAQLVSTRQGEIFARGYAGWLPDGSRWTDWNLFATATPPQEYDLPLAEGITTTQHCVYCKNKFEEVSVRGIANGSIVDGTIIATLPAGFRPAYNMEFPATFASDGDRPAGTISVNTDGTIYVQVISSSAAVIFCASFIAADI